MRGYLAEKLKMKMKVQEGEPDSISPFVMELTGRNFEEVVLDHKNDVLVLFCVEWSEDC